MSWVRTQSLVLALCASAVAEGSDDPCPNGSCPNPLGDGDGDSSAGPSCSLWLGPSPIKEAEEHGFGLGMFTGVDVPKGSIVGPDEILLPIYDHPALGKDHPPLREYVWGGDNMPEVPLESLGGARSTWLLAAGPAGITPCTSQNFNLELSGPGERAGSSRRCVESNPPGGAFPPRTSPLAGSFSYRQSVAYRAARDIVAGEELTVECSDDDFDGGNYYLAKFHSGDGNYVCVGDNVRTGPASSPEIGGRGLFAKRKISKGEVITSTPLIPVHRKVLGAVSSDEDGGSGGSGGDDKARRRTQLLLNYCYGHPDSDLLLLPYGPFANYVNHPPGGPSSANCELRWHPLDRDVNDGVARRQQYHHPELLDLPADAVAETHGKGLMMDFVATRDIEEDEEVFLDYGKEWTDAWRVHVEGWKVGEDGHAYLSAEEYCNKNNVEVVRTAEEQKERPYPDNLRTVCFYDNHAPELELDDDDSDDEEEDVVYTSWISPDPHRCLRPCVILDRYKEDAGGPANEGNGDDEVRYRAKMLPMETKYALRRCKLEGNYHVAIDVPREAILIVDRPGTTDVYLEGAFRREIGVPYGFYPQAWMRKKVRRRPGSEASEDGEAFKRKKAEDVA